MWSWHPLLMLSHVEAYSAQPVSDAQLNPRGDGDKKELVAGESTKETVKTIRAGKAGYSRLSLWFCRVLFYCTRTMGASRCPAFPAPS